MFGYLKTKVGVDVDNLRLWTAFRREVKEYQRNQISDDYDLSGLFRKLVKIVEIEPHSYCNRTCLFCGNSTLDRRSKYVPMQEKVYESILSDLATANYSGQIRFARYSEPLAGDHIFEKVAAAKEACPLSKTMIITNGDYLSSKKLNRLKMSGLDRLHISVYLSKKARWTDDAATRQIDKLLARLKVTSRDCSRSQGVIQGTIETDLFPITFNCVDWGSMGYNRGGMSDLDQDAEFQRTAPCMQVFHNVTIDFDGTVMPCCNLRSDDPDQKSTAYGIIKPDQNQTLMTIWDSQIAQSWRDGLSTFSPKKGLCGSCKQVLPISRLAPVLRSVWPS